MRFSFIIMWAEHAWHICVHGVFCTGLWMACPCQVNRATHSIVFWTIKMMDTNTCLVYQHRKMSSQCFEVSYFWSLSATIKNTNITQLDCAAQLECVKNDYKYRNIWRISLDVLKCKPCLLLNPSARLQVNRRLKYLKCLHLRALIQPLSNDETIPKISFGDGTHLFLMLNRQSSEDEEICDQRWLHTQYDRLPFQFRSGIQTMMSWLKLLFLRL